MKPILFDENATSFNTNGLGRLDCISCQVVEERNGMFELELQIAETALHAKEIEMSSIIVAKPSQDKGEQAFRVYKITKPIGGIFSVYARHISYQLSFIPVMPFAVTASAQAANQTLQGLKTNAVESCPFNFVTDVTTVASYKQTVPASLRSRLGGVEGSVLDQFGGEYEWDNYTVNLWRNRGVTTPRVTLRYGKNITDLNQEKNIEDTITGIVPYWQDSEGENTLTLPEKVVESQTAGSYPFKRTVPYDFSQSFEEGTIPTEAQLRAKATAYINQAGIGVPKVSIKVSFINLADTVEYKSIAALQTVELCDEVGVYFEKLGIETTAKVVKTEYDVLAERYISIELGSLRGTLASTISGQQASMNALANNTKRMFAQYSNEIGELVDEATAWLTSGDGYVMASKDDDGNWKEMFFLDTNDVETAVNVLRINQNGIGFSSSGIAGPYTQAWTLDGKIAIGGTNVPSLTVYDNNSNIVFQASKNGIIWNSTNTILRNNGELFCGDYSLGIDGNYRYYARSSLRNGGFYIYDISQFYTFPETTDINDNSKQSREVGHISSGFDTELLLDIQSRGHLDIVASKNARFISSEGNAEISADGYGTGKGVTRIYGNNQVYISGGNVRLNPSNNLQIDHNGTTYNGITTVISINVNGYTHELTFKKGILTDYDAHH